MSTIYWKFKNSKREFSSITFDSTHVSILDLKRAIIRQKNLTQSQNGPSFDLRITNAHTGVEYTDESGPIPRNLAVVVRRLPAHPRHARKLFLPLSHNTIIATADNVSKKTIAEKLTEEFGAPIYSDATSKKDGSIDPNAYDPRVKSVQEEQMNIIEMMSSRVNSAQQTGGNTGGHGGHRFNRNNHNGGGRGGGGPGGKQFQQQRGDPPPGYVCHRCHVPNHWIQDCPTNGDPKYDKKNRNNSRNNFGNNDVAKPVPATNVGGASGDSDQATAAIPQKLVIIGSKSYSIPTNVFESFKGDMTKIKEYINLLTNDTQYTQSRSSREPRVTNNQYSQYNCTICNNLYVDARFTPCCKTTYCNECIRQKASFDDPSNIQCPECDEYFDSEKLDETANVKLQSKVDKIVDEQKREQALQEKHQSNLLANEITITHTNVIPQIQSHNIPITTHNGNGTQTISIQHPITNNNNNTIQVIHAPKPFVRPTVILQQSPPKTIPKHNPYVPSTNLMATNQEIVTNSKQMMQPIDTTHFQAPAVNVPTDSNVQCLHCNGKGHKFKDCPVRRSEKEKSIPPSESQNNSDNDGMIQHNVNVSAMNAVHTHQNNHKSNLNVNNNRKNTYQTTNSFNTNRTRTNPQVQLINTSATAMSALNSLNALNAMNARMNQSLLINAALNNARRTHRRQVTPRIIGNSQMYNSNSLYQQRMPSNAGGFSNTSNPQLNALLQRQSLMNQRNALNQFTSNGLLGNANNNNNGIRNATNNALSNATNHLLNNPNRNGSLNGGNATNHNHPSLNSSIAALANNFNSGDPNATAEALRQALKQLGADPSLLQSLEMSSTHNLLSDATAIASKKSSKKRSKSRKKSKSKSRHKSKHKSSSSRHKSKKRKERRSKKKSRRRSVSRSSERSRSVSRSNSATPHTSNNNKRVVVVVNDGNSKRDRDVNAPSLEQGTPERTNDDVVSRSSVSDFPEPLDEVNTNTNNNDRKRKGPEPLNVPDFDVPISPPNKKQKFSLTP